MYKLELMLNNLILREYALADGAILMIGRHSANDIVLRDMSVSRHHATIEGRGQKLLIVDHASTNGTIVNGTRVQRSQLDHGDIVRIGKDYTIRVNVHSQKKRESTLTGEHDQLTNMLRGNNSSPDVL